MLKSVVLVWVIMAFATPFCWADEFSGFFVEFGPTLRFGNDSYNVNNVNSFQDGGLLSPSFGGGIEILMGHQWQFISLGLNGSFIVQELKDSSADATWRRYAIGAEGRVFPLDALKTEKQAFRPFFLTSVGLGVIEGLPDGFVPNTKLGLDLKVGGGFLWHLNDVIYFGLKGFYNPLFAGNDCDTIPINNPFFFTGSLSGCDSGTNHDGGGTFSLGFNF